MGQGGADGADLLRAVLTWSGPFAAHLFGSGLLARWRRVAKVIAPACPRVAQKRELSPFQLIQTLKMAHFRSQLRVSCDCKLTRNRTNSNFYTQPAIFILAPIWLCFTSTGFVKTYSSALWPLLLCGELKTLIKEPKKRWCHPHTQTIDTDDYKIVCCYRLYHVDRPSPISKVFRCLMIFWISESSVLIVRHAVFEHYSCKVKTPLCTRTIIAICRARYSAKLSHMTPVVKIDFSKPIDHLPIYGQNQCQGLKSGADLLMPLEFLSPLCWSFAMQCWSTIRVKSKPLSVPRQLSQFVGLGIRLNFRTWHQWWRGVFLDQSTFCLFMAKTSVDVRALKVVAVGNTLIFNYDQQSFRQLSDLTLSIYPLALLGCTWCLLGISHFPFGWSTDKQLYRCELLAFVLSQFLAFQRWFWFLAKQRSL